MKIVFKWKACSSIKAVKYKAARSFLENLENDEEQSSYTETTAVIDRDLGKLAFAFEQYLNR